MRSFIKGGKCGYSRKTNRLWLNAQIREYHLRICALSGSLVLRMRLWQTWCDRDISSVPSHVWSRVASRRAVQADTFADRSLGHFNVKMDLRRVWKVHTSSLFTVENVSLFTFEATNLEPVLWRFYNKKIDALRIFKHSDWLKTLSSESKILKNSVA